MDVNDTKDEISIEDILIILKKRIRLIAAFVTICTLSSIIISLFLTKLYRAELVIMPVGGTSSVLGGVLAQLGTGLPLTQDNSASAKITALLGSRTLAERVIDRFNLLKVFYGDLWDEKAQKWLVDDPQQIPTTSKAAKIFWGRLTIDSDKMSPVIKVALNLESPQLAADVTNGMADELQKFMNANSFSEEKKYRKFIGEQLIIRRKELLETGKMLSRYYEDNQISSEMPQITVHVDLQEDNNLDFLDGRIRNLEDQYQNTEQAVRTADEVKDVPQEIYFQYLSKKMEILSALTSLLSQQYEMAKINEAKEDFSFQVIDSAFPPDKKYKPKRVIIVGTTFAISSVLMVFFCLFKEYFDSLNLFKKKSV